MSEGKYVDLDGIEWEFMMYNSNPNDEHPHISVRRFIDGIIQICVIKDMEHTVSKTILDALKNKDHELFDELCKIANVKLFNDNFTIVEKR